jgi:hypothetical protein
MVYLNGVPLFYKIHNYSHDSGSAAAAPPLSVVLEGNGNKVLPRGISATIRLLPVGNRVPSKSNGEGGTVAKTISVTVVTPPSIVNAMLFLLCFFN